MASPKHKKQKPIIPGYILAKPIGHGGHSYVWEATNAQGVKVAVKVQRSNKSNKDNGRFSEEIAFLSKLKGRPGIMPIIDHGEASGLLWYAMPVAQLLSKMKLEASEAVDVVRKVSATLSALASEAAYHRDIKPENLFMLDGEPVIGDWGLVDHPEIKTKTPKGGKLGPTFFIAPEMLQRKDELGEKADVYSLAKTLWSLLTGYNFPLPGEHNPDSEAFSLRTYLTGYDYTYKIDQILSLATRTDKDRRIMTKKGIVISPPFRALPHGVECGGSPDAQDIRKYLFYWDEIDYPDNNIVSIGLSDDLSFLQSCGVLKRTRVLFQGRNLVDGTLFITAQEQAFQKNEEQERGQWSLAQLSDSQFYTNTSPEIGIEFELLNCLPVPQVDVPLNEILEFKEKRSSELLALRVHLDEMYQSVISASDIPRAKNATLDRLELSLKEINQVADEYGIKKVVTSLRGSVAGALDSGLRASGAAALYNASYVLPAFAVGAAVSFIIKPMLLPQNTESRNALTYINSIKQDFSLT